ncbi:MAG: ATPase domain-containing protein [Candidatus Thermoplasmatota archaeon]|nr:ATPase domain-containing protein [Candidatus Thermoplasmatota archaeon]
MKDRVTTYIPGLDELIENGFPRATINLLSGPPGSAKSLFGLQYVYNGAKYANEPGIYMSLEESRSNLMRAASAYGMDLESMEQAGKLFIVDLGKMRMESSSIEELDWSLVSFETLQDFLKNHLNFSKAKRLVLDSITAAGIYYSNNEQMRRELFRFSRFLRDSDITSVIISETLEGRESRYGIEEFIADSFLRLDYESTSGEYRRTLTVRKMRFTKHDPLKHPFLIMDGGIEVSPDEVI